MPDLFTLDQDTINTVESGIDALIHQLGKDCKLVYGGDQEICNNCKFDSVAKRSTNIYNGIGPKPFTSGRCPVCKGTGYLPGGQVQTEVIRLLMDWQPKPWLYEDPRASNDIRYPQGLVSTKGFAADMPKVMQAKYIIVDYTNATYESNKFTRFSEPVLQGNIVKSKYFLCFWQRYQD